MKHFAFVLSLFLWISFAAPGMGQQAQPQEDGALAAAGEEPLSYDTYMAQAGEGGLFKAAELLHRLVERDGEVEATTRVFGLFLAKGEGRMGVVEGMMFLYLMQAAVISPGGQFATFAPMLESEDKGRQSLAEHFLFAIVPRMRVPRDFEGYYD